MVQKATQPARSATLALMAILSLAYFGCGKGDSGQRGGLISLRLPMASYVKASSGGTSNSELLFFFPQLRIYNGSGELIYSSHESLDNARVLENLPHGIGNLRPRPSDHRLDEVLQEVRAAPEAEHEILEGHRITVLSILLDGCQGCKTQEDALDSVQDRLRKNGINLVIIHLLQSSP